MLFPPDFLTRLEYLSIVSRRVFRGSLLSQRRTLQHGSGIEISDHREYAPGDDFRYLDWNVYARLGDLLVKRFQEEQDLHVYFMLDCSRSMSFGDPAKFDLARQLVAALAYIALAELDRVAVLSFSEDVVSEFPLSRGRARILPLMRFLEAQPLSGADTALSRSVQGVLHRARRAGMVVIVSDLFDRSGFQTGLDQLRYRHFDCHILQLHALAEANPALLGEVELRDVETEQLRKVTVTERNVRAYRRLFRQHQDSVRDYCRNFNLGCTQSPSTVSFDDLVLRMMRESGMGSS